MSAGEESKPADLGEKVAVEGPAGVRGQWSRLGRTTRVLVGAIAVVLGGVAGMWILNDAVAYWMAKSYVQEVVDVFDLSPYLARALVLLSFILGSYLLGLAVSFSKTKRLIGFYGMVGVIVVHSVILWVGSRGTIVGRCYVVTKETVHYGERPGIDPATGRPCRPVTAELAERLRAYETGARPKRIEGGEPVFFDLRTGEPAIWFVRSKGNGIELFDLMGFHPSTGEELLPITKEVVEEWRAQVARRAPQRVDPAGVTPFDPLTGEARLWYKHDASGAFVFFDRPGFDPETGEKLVKADPGVIDAYKKQIADQNSPKCYIITKDAKAPVRYGNRLGIDPATGRECRALTAELIERLREYEKGNRPKRIGTDTPVFFDPRTGEPIVWYAKGRDGSIDIFDLMGFHPETGDELRPVDKEVVAAWKEAAASKTARPAKAPQRVEPRGYAFFDPMSGQPRAWYSRSADGAYEFFDAPGFHPQTGEPLTVISREVLDQWRKDEEASARKRSEDETRQQEERRLAAERSERDRRSGELCDEMAGNPTDPRSGGRGAPYEILKLNAKEAADVCFTAVTRYPTEVRYQYQYARAVQFIDKQKSFELQKKVAAQRYPSSFDNLGWLYIVIYKDYGEGVRQFKIGSDLGDPDSMVSLAEMIDRGYYLSRDSITEKMELYRRAKDLGHPAGRIAYDRALADLREQQEQEYRQQEVQKQMIGIVGGILGAAARGR